MTVTDPRHPLYGQTLTLVYITNKPYSGRCCVVWLQEGIERNVPVEATDRSTEPLIIFPLPLNLSSVRQLLATCERMVPQIMEKSMKEKEDESTQELNTSRANLEPANHSAAEDVVSSNSADVSNTDEEQQSQVYDGGQEDEP